LEQKATKETKSLNQPADKTSGYSMAKNSTPFCDRSHKDNIFHWVILGQAPFAILAAGAAPSSRSFQKDPFPAVTAAHPLINGARSR
jgi:hypothetical protein